ncbi:23S rRNA (pseudouridine(1915)-N(3))-methyltransferase RlmH [Candidatus Kinetoplastidibacterium crithidiae]|uniref:Ribosomal RNA large subunit methyltransferase H n=1 Tax=Candidatus Kinetoplastidibacterium crithidiae TCC036E TaxID=1208918 RepID=M1M5Q7_9PROT|nr:23S rRNA (pseudouridine(1915)-N(3))-methyltransferase RlmH [Candidatus Kinetoplastibacterium crithidii]AGF47490.1 SPOUT methyltransferase superfamily protein [Candidatus Kinetoplastibacterium crithidii TCC036E]
MIKITIITVSGNMPKAISSIWEEYKKRINKNYRIELKEIKPEQRNKNKTTIQSILEEGKRIVLAIPHNSYIIALDEKGEDYDTRSFAMYFNNISGKDITFIIGGADGLDESVKKICNKKIKLSSLTFPHHMVKIILIEQLYRVYSILNNHPYHRD